MPTPPLDQPHKKVTLNLWEKDVEYLKFHFTHWSEKVRDLVHDFVRTANRKFKDD